MSDELCQEYGLSVIVSSGEKGMTHCEWQEKKKGQSWKRQMKEQDQMLWVRRMNSIRVRAEEVVREETIYCL